MEVATTACQMVIQTGGCCANLANIYHDKEEIKEETALCPICYEEFWQDSSPLLHLVADKQGGKQSSLMTDVECIYNTNDQDDIRQVATTKNNHDCMDKNEQIMRKRVRVDGCGHEFCYECLVQHCKFAILRREIPIPCPQVTVEDDDTEDNGSDGTNHGHFLSPELIQRLLLPGKNSIMISNNNIQKNVWLPPPVKSTNQHLHHSFDHDIESGWNTEPVQMANTFSTASLSPSPSQSSSSSSSSTSISTSCSVSSLPEYWKKYTRVQRLKENPDLLTCPQCEELVVPPARPSSSNGRGGVSFNKAETTTLIGLTQRDTKYLDHQNSSCSNNDNSTNSKKCEDDELQVDLENYWPGSGGLSYPQVMCSTCDHAFCAIHGDIHSGETCESFAQSQRARDIEASEQMISQISKPCSHGCGANIVRFSGCDHLICVNCHQDMCYKCGTHQFLTGKVIRSCSGCKQGYVDHRYYNSYRLRLLFILPFHLALSAVYIAIVGALAVVTCGFGCCFGCGTRGWFCEPRQEQQSPTPSSSSRFGRMKPATGVWMTTRLICAPLIELIVDCGFHGVARDDERSQARKGND